MTTNAANAIEVTVSFPSFSPVVLNGTTDALSLKVFTRIGTNPDETKCPGHNNAVGVRLYFDATSRSARFDATIATQAAPVITSFAPTSGAVGTSVTITGQSFDPVAANNQVTFNGTPAIITSATATTIIITVPQNATIGPITVTMAQGTGASPQPFTVTGQTFDVGVLPAMLTVPASGQASFAMSLSGAGGFTNLATLAVTGVPAGTTATFVAPTLTAGQSTLLTLVTTGATPAGTYPITVSAAGLLNGSHTTRSVTVNVQVLAAGVTSLSGLVLDEDAKPVKEAIATLGALQTTTDDCGNFLILNPPVGPDQLFILDGGPASPRTTICPSFPTR